MKQKFKIIITLLLIAVTLNTFADVRVKLIEYSVSSLGEVLGIMPALSGKAISKSSRDFYVQQLSKMMFKHGDGAIKLAERGGLELIDAYAKYGDDILKYSMKVPKATRVLALHADELLPLTRKLGTSVLQIEAKTPGLTKHIIKSFGNDSVKYFAREVPSRDMTKLLGYASRADSQGTRKLLLQGYKKTGGNLLKHLDWKIIIASGLTSSMIIGAYKISDGVQGGLETVSKHSPETFMNILTKITDSVLFPFYILFGGGVILLLIYFFFKVCKQWKQNPAQGSDNG